MMSTFIFVIYRGQFLQMSKCHFPTNDVPSSGIYPLNQFPSEEKSRQVIYLLLVLFA